MIIDTHCHLNDPILYNDIDNVIQRALDNDVSKMICIGYDVESSKLAVDLAKKYKGIVYAMVGIHPENCKDLNIDSINDIEKLLSSPSVVGIGEIGLDYHWDTSYNEKQKEFFIEQVKLANKYNLPISIHCRDAIQDMYAILRCKDNVIKNVGILHCYGGSKDMVKLFSKLGLYFGFGGVLTFKNSKVMKESLLEVPVDHILVETDSPYLAPEPYRGNHNEPSYIIEVVKKMSELLNFDYINTTNLLLNNSKKVFNL